jgi:diaminopimelate decarboxylase
MAVPGGFGIIAKRVARLGRVGLGVQSTMHGPVPGFSRHGGVLTCDGVSLADIAAETGTPTHVYSAALLDERFRQLDAAFAGVPHRLHYAIKANATLAVVRRLRALGAGADANSGGEIEVALRAGFAPGDIVFTGVGKTPAELARAVELGVRAINAESPGEVGRIEAIAAAAGRRARVAIRVNPDVDAGTHPHISTGSHATKFGMTVDEARTLARDIAARPHLDLVGLHVHVGSQITRAEPIRLAVQTIVALAAELKAAGVDLDHLDFGGGLGIAYEPGDRVLTPAEYAAAILPEMAGVPATLLLEPGRWLVGPIGVIVTEVVDLKPRAGGGWFVIVDAGMTDLIRPALYGAWHGIEAVQARPGEPVPVDVVGPVCESSDVFGADRLLPLPRVGDLLAIRDTGAYGAVMASNYNRRPMAAEVMVDAGAARVVRRRQSLDDLLQWDE